MQYSIQLSIPHIYFKTFSASDKNPEPVMLSNKLSSINMSSLSSRAPCAEQNIKFTKPATCGQCLDELVLR